VLDQMKIGFLGAGNLAEALIGGMLKKGLVRPAQVVATNRSNRERLRTLQQRYGIQVTTQKAAVVEMADLLVLACKPKDVAELLAEVGARTRPGQVVLSVVAGMPTERMLAGLTAGVELIRCMPNTSCLVGESATAIARGPGASDRALQLCREVLETVGAVVVVEEAQLDAVTGLSGSGPAYIYLMIEAMVAAGEQVGLTEALARDLALQTLKGAARMLEVTGDDPGALRERVTSPGGTTYAGLQALRERGFEAAVVEAVARATHRAGELGGSVAASRAG
jgi:pyrroline-5-carboxylate reductase